MKMTGTHLEISDSEQVALVVQAQRPTAAIFRVTQRHVLSMELIGYLTCSIALSEQSSEQESKMDPYQSTLLLLDVKLLPISKISFSHTHSHRYDYTMNNDIFPSQLVHADMTD